VRLTISLGHRTVVPCFVQYTNVYVDGFSEKCSVAPLSIHSIRSIAAVAMSFPSLLPNGGWDRLMSKHFSRRLGNMISSISTLPLRWICRDAGPSATFPWAVRDNDSAVVDGRHLQCHDTAQFALRQATMAYSGVTYYSNGVMGGVRIIF